MVLPSPTSRFCASSFTKCSVTNNCARQHLQFQDYPKSNKSVQCSAYWFLFFLSFLSFYNANGILWLDHDHVSTSQLETLRHHISKRDMVKCLDQGFGLFWNCIVFHWLYGCVKDCSPDHCWAEHSERSAWYKSSWKHQKIGVFLKLLAARACIWLALSQRVLTAMETGITVERIDNTVHKI